MSYIKQAGLSSFIFGSLFGQRRLDLTASRFLGLLSASLFLSGCTPDLDIKAVTEAPPALAVNCIFAPGEPWDIRVVSTKSAYDSLGYLSISDAAITVSYDGGEIGDFVFVPSGNPLDIGRYTNRTPVGGVPLGVGLRRILVRRAGFPDAEAIDTVPPAPMVDAVALLRSSVIDRTPNFPGIELPPSYLVAGLLRITLRDATGRHWYRIRVRSHNDYWLPPISSNLVPLRDSIYYSDAGLNWPGQDLEIYHASFSDATFDGRTKDILVDFSSPARVRTGPPAFVLLEISTISYAHYAYLKKLQEIQLGQSPFSEPIQAFSNIEGGYGIFAAYHPVVDTIWLQ